MTYVAYYLVHLFFAVLISNYLCVSARQDMPASRIILAAFLASSISILIVWLIAIARGSSLVTSDDTLGEAEPISAGLLDGGLVLWPMLYLAAMLFSILYVVVNATILYVFARKNASQLEKTA